MNKKAKVELTNKTGLKILTSLGSYHKNMTKSSNRISSSRISPDPYFVAQSAQLRVRELTTLIKISRAGFTWAAISVLPT